MYYRYLKDPSRNFCIMASTVIIDPKDGREKIVLSSFVSGGTGRLFFIDTQSEEGESLELPGDEGAWALLCLNGEKLLVGTCSHKGYLHCLDLKSRTWAEPLRDENETYIWNLTLGSDGMVYGGTYPGCVLLRYNPKEHKLENLGRMSPIDKGNRYSRFVYGGAPSRIFIDCEYQEPHIAVWDMETCTVRAFGKEGAEIKEVNSDFVCTVTGDKLDFYDSVTLEPISVSLSTNEIKSFQLGGKDPVSRYIEKLAATNKDSRLPEDAERILELKNGDITGIRGQEYFILKKKDVKLKLKRIPVEAPPTQILTIASSPDGKIWGSSGLGQTICYYDTENGTYWNSPTTVCDSGGEVYGIRCIKGKIFMSAYAGGDHVVYDPSKPWDQMNNINPVTLKSVGPDLDRPFAKSVVGPDGAFWTGWTANYGVYGGGISRVDINTYEMKSWYDPIPKQRIESLAAGEKYLYFTTGGRGNGLKTKIEPFHLGVWDPAGRLIHNAEFPEGVILGCIEIVGKYGIVDTGEELKIFDCNTMEFRGSIKLPGSCSCIMKYNEDKAAVFCDEKVFFVNPATEEVSLAAELPGIVSTAAIGKNGELYFAYLSHLYKLVDDISA